MDSYIVTRNKIYLMAYIKNKSSVLCIIIPSIQSHFKYLLFHLINTFYSFSALHQPEFLKSIMARLFKWNQTQEYLLHF